MSVERIRTALEWVRQREFQESLTTLISISLVGGTMGRAFEYLVYLAIARILGPGALGLFSFGFVILSVGTIFAKLGLDKAARKYVPVHVDDEASLSGVLIVCLGGSFLAGVVVGFLGYLGSGWIAGLTSASFGAVTLLFLVGIPFKATMTVGKAATTGFLTTRYSVYIKDFGQSGAAILFVVIAGFSFGTVGSVVMGYVASIVFGSVLALAFLARQGGFDGIARPKIEAREILTYSIPLTLAAVAQYLVNWTDILMLGALVPAEAVGTYQAAYQTATVLGFLIVAVGSIFPSVASELYDAGKTTRLHDIYSALTKWITYFALLGYLFLTFHAESVLSLFGRDFVAGTTPLLILGAAFVVSSGVGPAGMLLMMTDYERVEMLNTFLVSGLNVVLNFVLISEYGILGAAVATGLSIGLLNVLRFIEVWSFTGMVPRFTRYWKGVVALGVAAGVMTLGRGLPTPALQTILLTGGLSFCAFALTMFVLGEDPEDRRLVRSVT